MYKRKNTNCDNENFKKLVENIQKQKELLELYLNLRYNV